MVSGSGLVGFLSDSMKLLLWPKGRERLRLMKLGVECFFDGITTIIYTREMHQWRPFRDGFEPLFRHALRGQKGRLRTVAGTLTETSPSITLQQRPELVGMLKVGWSWREESNLQPAVYKISLVPTPTT
ncbi:MAG: hypothetical protein OJF50_001984 [Nitrospira sp.]|nr:hypothetical protein [Nitrospira sp.]